jgi:hypothetical protein
MEPINEFSFVTHDGPYEQWPEKTELLRHGQRTGAFIPGYVIEAQYRCMHGVLLVTSYDCPFEESNDFILLTDEYTLLAHTQLVVPYGSYLLHAHWPLDSHQLRLHYHTRLFYTLSIKPPSGLFGSRFRLSLQCEGALRSDARANASVAELERQLESVRDTLGRTASSAG